MNESSEAYIEECEDHQFSDYDDSGSSFGSDSSSSGRSELDDEYFKNTEKPIPVDELIRNTINPFILEQLDSNQNSPSIDNSAVAAENFTSNDFFYAEYLQRTFGYDDKPIEINNDVVDLDSFCVVRKKKRGKRKDQDSQTETNYYESNVYNWLVNNEDVDRELENGMGLEDQDIKLKNDCETNLNLKKEERRNVKTSSSTSLKEKKKNEKEKVITTTDNNKGIDETITDLNLNTQYQYQDTIPNDDVPSRFSYADALKRTSTKHAVNSTSVETNKINKTDQICNEQKGKNVSQKANHKKNQNRTTYVQFGLVALQTGKLS